MRITERHKRWLLLVLYLVLPLLLAAQDDSTAVEEHYLWDSEAPVSIDSVSEWWVQGGLVERQVPAAVMDKLKADKRLQYDKPLTPRDNWMAKLLEQLTRFLFRIRVLILVLLVLGVIAGILFLMRQYGFRFFRRKGKEETAWATAEEPGFEGYARQAQEAIAAGRFRQAVRYLYLQTLGLLSNKQLITLSKDKTNAHYLHALLPTRWHRPFARLTLDYEYVWYGEMAVNPEQFEHIHGEFRRFINDLSNGER